VPVKKKLLNFLKNQPESAMFYIRGNFKSLQKWQKILVAICQWSVFGGYPVGSHAQTTISNSSTIFFSAKFCRTFEITSLV